jgi:hypothetical protein
VCSSDLLYVKYRAKLIYIEDNADKGYTADKLEELGIHVSSYSENTNKDTKISVYLKYFWERLHFHKDNNDGTMQSEWNDEYMLQVTDLESGQEPDDAPDSAASLLKLEFSNEGKDDILFDIK